MYRKNSARIFTPYLCKFWNVFKPYWPIDHKRIRYLLSSVVLYNTTNESNPVIEVTVQTVRNLKNQTYLHSTYMHIIKESLLIHNHKCDRSKYNKFELIQFTTRTGTS